LDFSPPQTTQSSWAWRDKHLRRLLVKFIAKIFNRPLVLNDFPTQWKDAKIIMLPKPEPGKEHIFVVSYRPISLLNIYVNFLRK
jgi:hypothetical protein